MTRKLFHITNSSIIFGCLVGLVCITNATVILGCLVYLVCYHQCHRHTQSLGLSCLSSPSSPSYWLLGLSCLSSTKFTFIFGCLVCLVCYQPISPSYLVVLSISNRDGHISAGIFETMLASYVVQFCWKQWQPLIRESTNNQRLLVPSLLFQSMPCYLQTTLTHQLWQVIQLSGLITTNPICVLDNILYLDPPLLLSEKQVNPPYHGYVAISRLLYHIKATVPPTVKAKPTKNFSSKRKLPYHKICRSACFSPPPFFLFKAFTFYPCVSYFIFLLPLLTPLLVGTSPGGIKKAALVDDLTQTSDKSKLKLRRDQFISNTKCLPQ